MYKIGEEGLILEQKLSDCMMSRACAKKGFIWNVKKDLQQRDCLEQVGLPKLRWLNEMVEEIRRFGLSVIGLLQLAQSLKDL